MHDKPADITHTSTRGNLRTQWKPGQSGNPKGRRRGSKNKATLLRDGIDVERILATLATAALKGDVSAARVLLERALPPPRSTYPLVTIPAAKRAATLTETAQAIVRAVASGEVAADVGAALVNALAQTAHVAELDELERRLAALEERDDDSSEG